MLRKLIATLAALFIASTALLLVFFRAPGVGTIEMEAAKGLLQLGVVAVAGTVVSLLLFEYQRDRNNQDKEQNLFRMNIDYRDRLLRTTLSNTITAYSQAKKARRMLRARAITEEMSRTRVQAALYDQYFDIINDAQLVLENQARDVFTSKPAFSTPEKIASNLDLMENYLSKLMSEYEKGRRRFAGEKPALGLDQLPLLDDFIAPTAKSAFKSQVVIPFREVQSAIRSDLIQPQLRARDATLHL